ncbi:maleylacetoacetate isomerase [Novosphingobium naphthalenivorans]|uniref:maleylacetoacetate isomerase n=1 Tax=Novosphingobium naphthalenivorans TaxID=273168 RepID=UPI00082A6B64|nr:maleylacetoacetate isomerase [Novosphingobium naphthalenivorans]
MTAREVYGFFRSSTSYRLRLALAAKGLDYSPRFISLPGGAHRTEAFLAINPQGLVPVLREEGRAFTQSLAILEYLEERYPEPPLLPADLVERAYVRALSQVIACDIHPLNNVRVLTLLRQDFGIDDGGVQRWYEHWIATGMASFEAMLSCECRHGRYCLGDKLTIADLCLVPQVANARRFACDLSPFPLSCGIAERVEALDVLAPAAPGRQADAF